MTAQPPIETVVGLTQVLYDEALALDEGRFEDWLAMLDPEIRYVAPIRQDLAPDTPLERTGPVLSFFEESLPTLGMRVAKLRTGLSQTESPPSRVVRLISNVRVGQLNDLDGIPVSSAFVVYRQHRQRDIEILAGRRKDTWRRRDGVWRLLQREILFAANVLPVKSLPLFY